MGIFESYVSYKPHVPRSKRGPGPWCPKCKKDLTPGASLIQHYKRKDHQWR